MRPGLNDRGGGGADADFAGIGFTALFTAVSFLLLVVSGGGGDAGGTGFGPGTEWQVILAFGLMSAGLLCVMHGMRARGARPPGFVRRAAHAAVAVLWHAWGTERLLPVVILLMCPFLEAWFDFL